MADHFDITQIGFWAEPEVVIKKNDEDNCIDRIQHFNAVNIEILTELELEVLELELEVKKTKLSNDGSFYIKYSPEKITLRLRDSAMLN